MSNSNIWGKSGRLPVFFFPEEVKISQLKKLPLVQDLGVHSFEIKAGDWNLSIQAKHHSEDHRFFPTSIASTHMTTVQSFSRAQTR